MIYLIGGGRPPWSKELNAHLFNTLKDMKSILFIPTELEDVKRNNMYQKAFSEYFYSIGLTLENIHCVKTDDTITDILNHIDNSDIVFLLGGRTIPQLEWCKQPSINEALQNYKGIFIGTSAGALNLCKKSIITKDRGYSETLIFDGLNIADGINIEVHYDEKNEEKDMELRKLIEKGFDCIYAIPEGCALVKDSKNINYLGSAPLTMYVKNNADKCNLDSQNANVKYVIV